MAIEAGLRIAVQIPAQFARMAQGFGPLSLFSNLLRVEGVSPVSTIHLDFKESPYQVNDLRPIVFGTQDASRKVAKLKLRLMATAVFASLKENK